MYKLLTHPSYLSVQKETFVNSEQESPKTVDIHED
jgi:hypothetical protein